MKLCIGSAILLIFSQTAHGAASAQSAKAEIKKIEINVRYGDKITSTKIDTEKKQVERNGVKRSISDVDLEHMRKLTIDANKEKSNDFTLCPREHIEIVSHYKAYTKSMIGCIGSPSPAAQQLTRIANTTVFL